MRLRTQHADRGEAQCQTMSKREAAGGENQTAQAGRAEQHQGENEG